MTLMATGLSDWFWNERVWLPPNVTWEHLKSSKEAEYYEFHDLLIPLPAAFLIILCRRLFEQCACSI